jgi:predicted pyridoxine 5'-phosphate oxidase superfamily flavin-nucleotide-binding protein
VSDDGRTLYLPDRRGNNRLDIIRNLLAGSGKIGLMFMIPGFEDIYRVNGRASASADPDLLARFVEFGKTPLLVLAIAVEEAFFHCPKALMRGRLWEADAQVDRATLPTLAEMIFDQLNLGKVPISEDQIQADYKTQL